MINKNYFFSKSFIFALFFGIIINLYFYFNKTEIWDVENSELVFIYFGVFLGIFFPQEKFLSLIGLFVGQIIFWMFSYILSLFVNVNGANLFFPIGILYIMFYEFLAYLGLSVGSFINIGYKYCKKL